MNVLLISPKFPDTFWSFKYALSFIHKKAAFPPLGLLTVAALLPDYWKLQIENSNRFGRMKWRCARRFKAGSRRLAFDRRLSSCPLKRI